MNGVIKNKKPFLLIGLIIFLFSCEKTELNEVEELIGEILPEKELYKESYLNQSSGISFTWSDIDRNAEYITNMIHSDLVQWYGNGQSYHDVNNDGYEDILVNPHNTNEQTWFEWYINQGDNKTYVADKNYITESTQGFSSHKFIKTDVNNDGNADFIAFGVDERIPNDYNGNFTVLINNNNKFIVKNIPNPNKFWFHNGSAGDLNGDGFVDVASGQYIWYGDGTGNFINSNIDLNIYTKAILTYEIIDFNKDGYNDIVLGSHTEHGVTTIVLNDKGKFTENNKTLKLQKTGYNMIMDIEIKDIDRDGNLDILEMRQNSENISLIFLFKYRNEIFELDTKFFENSTDGNYINGERDKFGWSVFKFDDIDGDGKEEIITENYQDGTYNGMKFVNGIWEPAILY